MKSPFTPNMKLFTFTDPDDSKNATMSFGETKEQALEFLKVSYPGWLWLNKDNLIVREFSDDRPSSAP